jgi:hypothetical protein
MDTVRISTKHCRAICDEIGERLRQHIDRNTTAPSRKILELLLEFEIREIREIEGPSIAPSLGDLEAFALDSAIE